MGRGRAVELPAPAGRDVEGHGHAGHLVLARQVQPAAATARVQPQGVDDGGEPAAKTHPNHLVQERERILACMEVVLTCAHQCPKAVGRDDLLGREVTAGPRALAAGSRPDQDHQARVGQVDAVGVDHRRGHVASLVARPGFVTRATSQVEPAAAARQTCATGS
jgi:hypothetical protein